MDRASLTDSLSKQILFNLFLLGLVTAVVFVWFLSSSIRGMVDENTQAKAQELLSRSAEMFMVSTRSFNEEYAAERDPQAKARILQKWNETITAVDTAVINDFGDKQSRVRLFHADGIISPPRLGGNQTLASGDFELSALRAFSSGEGLRTERSAERYTMSVPLYSDMHPGCANCHGVSTSEKILLGGVSVSIPLKEVNRAAWNRILTNSAVMVVILLLFLGMVYIFLSKKVISPINSLSRQTATVTKAIEAGQVDQSISVDAEHEIREMAGNFDELLTVIRRLFTNMISTSEQISSAAEQTSAMAAENRQGAVKQKSNIDNIRTALDELEKAGNMVSERTQRTADTSDEVNLSVKEGGSLVEMTSSAIEDLASEVSEASTAIQNLDKSSENIGSIVSTIEGIAEQTNLLALNATIEAARAGEQGRGFAVVADEVRSLAQRTQEATREINKLIVSLQSDSRTANEVIHVGAEKATKTVDHAQRALQQLHKIASQVVSINEMNRDIAAASEEQTSTLSSINQLTQGVSNETNNIVNAAESMAKESEGLKTLSYKISEIGAAPAT